MTDESSERDSERDLDTGPAAADDDSDTGPAAADDDDLDDEQRDAIDQAQQAMDEARSRLAEVPAEVVVTNHVMGLYELGAIHLAASPPDLRQAALAIDAVAYLVDGLGDRLGDDAATMRDALTNIRLAFVQIKGAAATDASGVPDDAGSDDAGSDDDEGDDDGDA